jgi:Rrf2 family protein
MDIIRRKTDYGLRALVSLTRADRPLRAEELAELEGVPVPFLHKALKDLGAVGIVDGQRGPSGGFTLARPANEVTVLQAVEAMQGPVMISRCLLGDNACDRQRTCGLRRTWQKAQESMVSFLRDLTLEDLVGSLGARGRARGRKRAARARKG